MKPDDWNVEDAQVIEKTGKPIAHWIKALVTFKAADRTSNDVVATFRPIMARRATRRER